MVTRGPVQVRTRFEPKVWSNQRLDLNLPKRVRSSFELTRTLGPLGPVRFEPGSEVRRTGLRTVYIQCVLEISPSLLQSEACQTPISQTVQQSDVEGGWLYSTAAPSYLLKTNEDNQLLGFEVAAQFRVLTAFAIHVSEDISSANRVPKILTIS